MWTEQQHRAMQGIGLEAWAMPAPAGVNAVAARVAEAVPVVIDTVISATPLQTLSPLAESLRDKVMAAAERMNVTLSIIQQLKQQDWQSFVQAPMKKAALWRLLLGHRA